MAWKDAFDALARANPKWFEAWHLKFIEGLKHKEIAEKLGYSPESSRQNVRKARIFLCDWFGGRENAWELYLGE